MVLKQRLASVFRRREQQERERWQSANREKTTCQQQPVGAGLAKHSDDGLGPCLAVLPKGPGLGHGRHWHLNGSEQHWQTQPAK